MGTRLWLSEHTKLGIRYSTDDLLDRLRPFICRTGELLGGGWSLADSVNAAADANPEAASYFDMRFNGPSATFSLKNEYLFQDWRVDTLDITGGPRGSRIRVSLRNGSDAGTVGAILRQLAGDGLPTTEMHHDMGERWLQTQLRLLDRGILTTKQPEQVKLNPLPRPGVYRLQHASLLYRSRTTGLLVDPHLHSSYSHLGDGDVAFSGIKDAVSALAITHFHGDHWSLSTLMMFPRDMPIIVPLVPAASVICADMRALLESLGFTRVLTPAWNSVVELGDMKIHILPFYGEQPLRDEPVRAGALRNWGNTYLVETDDFTSWLLVDTGSDASGSMVGVAEQVRQRVPQLDIVLSNLRRFAPVHPLYINCGLNWLTLDASQLVRFKEMQDHCLTLGPDRVAKICRITGATYYLPYAHWWGPLGQHGQSGIDTPGQEELPLVQELAGELARAGAATSIVPWRIGDGFVVSGRGSLERRKVEECFTVRNEGERRERCASA